ncbi:hypothetical protein ACOACO_10565 [Nocardioides sp. CPCC 205120]|uniref:hypothetical protein n=1 Tax=Nocardioides sp. CPCC 205120 TaxID=3406462 RepID=UPI003B5032A8
MADPSPPRVVDGATHNGIPTTTLEGAYPPYVGTLSIGVGTADEAPLQMGITHLAEHLVFRVLDETIPPRAEGITSAHTLEFSVTGTPAEVAAGLNQIGAVLAAPHFDPNNVDRERRVVRAERGGGGVFGAGLLTYRYGVGGVGNAHHTGEPATSYLTAPDAQQWISTWATRSNARLHFAGPVPAGLNVQLPERPVPARSVSVPLVTRPSLVESGKGGVALSLLVDAGLAPILRDVVVHDLLRALRHDCGLIYSVIPEITGIGEGRAQLDFVLDPVEDDVARTVEEATLALRRIARDGVSAMGLARTQTGWRNDLDNPYAWGRYLDAATEADLQGFPRPPEPPDLLRIIETITPHELTKTLADALGSLLVAYDETEELRDGLADELGLVLDDFSPWRPATSRRPRRWTARARPTGRYRRRVMLGVADTVLWRRLRDDWETLDLTTLALVGLCPDGALELMDGRGRACVLDLDDWNGGERFREAVLAATPHTIQRDMSLFHD